MLDLHFPSDYCGKLHNKWRNMNTEFNVGYLLVACAVAGTAVGVVLKMHDRRNGGKLNRCDKNKC